MGENQNSANFSSKIPETSKFIRSSNSQIGKPSGGAIINESFQSVQSKVAREISRNEIRKCR